MRDRPASVDLLEDRFLDAHFVDPIHFSPIIKELWDQGPKYFTRASTHTMVVFAAGFLHPLKDCLGSIWPLVCIAHDPIPEFVPAELRLLIYKI